MDIQCISANSLVNQLIHIILDIFLSNLPWLFFTKSQELLKALAVSKSSPMAKSPPKCFSFEQIDYIHYHLKEYSLNKPYLLKPRNFATKSENDSQMTTKNAVMNTKKQQYHNPKKPNFKVFRIERVICNITQSPIERHLNLKQLKQNMDNKSYFLNQLNKLIEEYNSLKSTAKQDDFSDKKEEFSILIAKAKATVQRIIGDKSEYYKEIIRVLESKEYDGEKLKPIMGTIIALKEDLENDFLKNLGEIIHSEIFTDFIEMAEHLLSEGYKDASAVISGSTLESHLKKLSLKNSINLDYTNQAGKILPKKADTLNAELYKNTIYNSGIQKQITAWLDIRNNAAHGNYSEYTDKEVDLMIKGIINFIASNPA